MSGSVARARAALRSTDFARLLQARLLSQFADGVFQAFLIDRLVFLSPDAQGTAAGVAKAFAVLVIPFSIVGPFAGVLIDRWSRRRILLWTPLVRAAFVLALIPLHGGGWILYVPTLVVVSLNRFYLSTAGAVMPASGRSAPRSARGVPARDRRLASLRCVCRSRRRHGSR